MRGSAGQIQGPASSSKALVTFEISTGGKFQSHYLAAAHFKALPTTKYKLRKTFNSHLKFSTTMSCY